MDEDQRSVGGFTRTSRGSGMPLLLANTRSPELGPLLQVLLPALVLKLLILITATPENDSKEDDARWMSG